MTETKTKKPRQTFKQLKEEIVELKQDIEYKEEALNLLRGMVNALTIQNQDLTEKLNNAPSNPFSQSKIKGWWRKLVG